MGRYFRNFTVALLKAHLLRILRRTKRVLITVVVF